LRREDEEPGRREAGGDEARAAGDDAPAAGKTPVAGPFAQPWLLAACLCLLAAAASLVLGYFDAAFVAAALGAVAWFLNVRSNLPRPPDGEDLDDDDEQK
jgi:hypothetical protein